MVGTSSPALTESTEATVVETTTTTTTRTETLWAELQQIQQNEMATLKRQRAELEHEKASVNTLAPDASDIVTISVGGELILQAARDTLCLVEPGSRFAALISGRWEDHCVKDAQDRIVLDRDPELVRMIVTYLRNKLFFTKPFSPLDVSKLTVIQPGESNVTTQRVGNCLQLSNGCDEYQFVACTPRLVPGTQSSWKVTINKLPTVHGGWIFVGLIGNANAANDSFNDSTSFGWAANHHVCVAGCVKPGAGDWTHFAEGECLLFGLANNKLTMFSLTKSRRFVIDDVPDGEKFIHFNFYDRGTTLTLEPLDATEYAKLMA
jgi:hypothetical protein